MMPSKMTNMKFTKNSILILLLALSGSFMSAQEILKDTVPAKKPQPSAVRQKIDGVVATVGDYQILESDIDKTLIELKARGSSQDIPRCQLLGKLLEDRLYAHQAVVDSVEVSDAEINSEMEEKIQSMLEQVDGGMDKLVKLYKKNTEEEFRTAFFDILKMQRLSSAMTKKIVDKVDITPEEVRNFFKSIPKDELPLFNDEIEISQIVVKPVVSQEEKQKVIDKLKEFKREVLAGESSFFSKAVLYSQDPGSKSNGGFYKMNRKTPFIKEFKDVAFSLGEGEISEPFETTYGFHIIYVEKIRGQDVELRHILIAPRVTDESLREAKDKITQIRNAIVGGEISFADAAKNESDEKETRANGGQLINPQTLDSKFDQTKMDPSLYSDVSGLQTGEVSQPILDQDATSQKLYKLIKVTNRIPSHTADYSKDYLKIKDLALKEKQIKEVGKWSAEKIKETYIKINGEYRNCEFANNWLKK